MKDLEVLIDIKEANELMDKFPITINCLANCPFCGKKPRLEDHRLLWTVTCECGASMLGDRVKEPASEEECDTVDWGAIRESAIDKWNGRK